MKDSMENYEKKGRDNHSKYSYVINGVIYEGKGKLPENVILTDLHKALMDSQRPVISEVYKKVMDLSIVPDSEKKISALEKEINVIRAEIDQYKESLEDMGRYGDSLEAQIENYKAVIDQNFKDIKMEKKLIEDLGKHVEFMGKIKKPDQEAGKYDIGYFEKKISIEKLRVEVLNDENDRLMKTIEDKCKALKERDDNGTR